MTTVFVASDWHGDWITDGRWRLGDLQQQTDRLLADVEETPGDKIFVFLGDLSNPYSRHVHHAVAHGVRVASRLNILRVPNYWLVGNHDIIEDDRVSHTLLELAALDHPTLVIDRPMHTLFGDQAEAIWLPYTSPRNAYSPADFVGSVKGQGLRRLIFGHLNIEGITAGSETHSMARGRDVFWPFDAIANAGWGDALWFNGHYHEQQIFRGIHIPGALLRLCHGEEDNNPGYLRFTL